ncbi:MAG: hypothetical protein H0X25_12745, partial [Acidobacteriales bacterium]|nr:hypothetical protein [Terriglobales bacterium]
MLPEQAGNRAPQWYWIPLRVLLVTFLLVLLSFAVTLLLAIVGLLVRAKVGGAAPNMTMAYRSVAAPVAAVVGVVVLVWMVVVELRRYRQA